MGDRRSRVCWGLVEGQPGEDGEAWCRLPGWPLFWLSCLCSCWTSPQNGVCLGRETAIVGETQRREEAWVA